MLDVAAPEVGLPQCRLHRASSSVAIFRAGGDVIGIGCGAVAHDLGDGLGTTLESMFELFNNEDTCAFAHNEAVPVPVEGPGGPGGGFVEARRKCTRCGDPAETDKINAGFSAATNCNVCLSGLDQTCGIADCLYACSARGDGCSDRALETVSNGDMAGCEVCQERRNGERRESTYSPLVRRANRLRNRWKTADAGCDHCSCPFQCMRLDRRPSRLCDGLRSREQGATNEAIHLPLIFARCCQIRIEAPLGIIRCARDEPCDTSGEGCRPRWQSCEPRPSGEQSWPDQFTAAAER